MIGVGVHLNVHHPLVLSHLLQGSVQLLCPQNMETFMCMTGIMVFYRGRNAEAASMMVVPVCSCSLDRI